MAKTVFITSTSASTYTIPLDYGSLVAIHCIGAGGAAGGQGSGGGATGGGGGGAYAVFTSELTSLLLHFNGANASTTFTDSGPFGLSVTAGGNAQLSTAQQKFGTASVLFDGNLDTLQLPSSPALDFGTGAFTIEFFMRTNGIQDEFSTIISRTENAPSIGGADIFEFGNRDNSLRVVIGDPGTEVIALSTTANDGAWHHVAISRSGSNVWIGLDGTIVASSTSLSISQSVTISSGRIGGWQGNNFGNNNYNGYLDEFRVIKGAALYTSTYTVPIEEFTVSVVPTLTPGQVVSVAVGTGGTGGANTGINGTPGGDTWFNSSATVLAKGGGGSATNQNSGAAGGQAAASVGNTRFSGGTGGNGGGNNQAGGGGGGAAGPNGKGSNGNSNSGTSGGSGGSGNNNQAGGGAGGSGGNPGQPGGAGTFWTASVGGTAGPGGGSGSANQGNGNQAGIGGAYGGGAGASSQTQGTNVASGGNGLIVFIYNPATSNMVMMFN